MYIFSWNQEDGGYPSHWAEVVVHHDNVLKLARIFEDAKRYFKVGSGSQELPQDSFFVTNFKYWLNPSEEFQHEHS